MFDPQKRHFFCLFGASLCLREDQVLSIDRFWSLVVHKLREMEASDCIEVDENCLDQQTIEYGSRNQSPSFHQQ